ncbi:serine hydrolase [Microbacterium sp. G2-8]|uniref:serine hydrolase domain-containing protein n=1 Tax=Microbacterium sp. G2-8 TaxID=2842454 RepID=UPI001C89963E|nr:serine hydrolase domain-containing protein [Microbacterium sp. G2-8]
MISRGPLATFVARATAHDIAVHSLEVTSGGTTLASAGAPWRGVDAPHRMYSVAKSLTALLVCELAAVGRIDLRDPILRHFPDLSTDPHPWLAQTTIADVLSMRGPHAKTTYEESEPDWLASYFRVVPTHRPGTLFTYDTSGSYVLSALVERITGQTLGEVMREQLIAPLGDARGFRMITGPDGVGHGGSGLVCTPRVMLRLAEAINADGVWQGSRILAPETARLAARRHNDASMQTWGASLRAGYGYGFWLPPEGGWMMFGLGGQIVYGDPSRDVAAVVTADAKACQSGDQRLVDLLLDALGNLSGAETELDLDLAAPSHTSADARAIAGRFAAASGRGQPATIDLALSGESCTLRFDGRTIEAVAGSPHRFALADLGDGVATAGWTAPGVLQVRVDALGDDIATVRIRVVATADDAVTIQAQGFGPAVDPSWTWMGDYARIGS